VQICIRKLANGYEQDILKHISTLTQNCNEEIVLQM